MRPLEIRISQLRSMFIVKKENLSVRQDMANVEMRALRLVEASGA